MIEDYMFTSAVFAEVDPKVLERLLKMLQAHIRVTEKLRGCEFKYKVDSDIGLVLKAGGKVFSLTECHITRWGNLSVYMESEDLLLRISDHWSSGSDVRNCGSIKTCNWQLRTKTHTVLRFKKHRMQGGFCKKRVLLASKI
jgi:hypothetical protein